MSADLFAAFMADEGEASASSLNSSSQAQSQNSQSRAKKGGQFHTPERQLETKAISPLWKQSVAGTDVLFDADDTGDDEDFGDFEDVHAGNEAVNASETIASAALFKRVQSTDSALKTSDLLDIHEDDWDSHEPAYIATPSNQIRSIHVEPTAKSDTKKPDIPWDIEWGDFEQIQTEDKAPIQSRRPHHPEPPNTTIVPVSEGETEDDWEKFEDGQPPQPERTDVRQIQPPTPKSAALPKTSSISTTLERPTNIPPPATLLQLVCSVLESIRDVDKYQVDSKQDKASKILITFRVASRIIAGRTLRWKRDNILAQSVRIGQAGKSGGMKLASVNKGESAREEREVEDLINQWSRHTHEFHRILAQAHTAANRLKLSPSPISRVLRAAGPNDTSKQCALCGLKRGERINDVDIETEDLFGEFWIEHWGHKDCSEFWHFYKDLLGQR